MQHTSATVEDEEPRLQERAHNRDPPSERRAPKVPPEDPQVQNRRGSVQSQIPPQIAHETNEIHDETLFSMAYRIIARRAKAGEPSAFLSVVERVPDLFCNAVLSTLSDSCHCRSAFPL